MQIELAPNVALLLETTAVQSGNLEFSGFGYVEWIKDTQTFYVYDVVMLDVGSSGWTEIPAEKQLPLLQRPDAAKMKLWFHRHPIGSGVPGPDNWSGTDHRTCREEPLGVPRGMQDTVRWALAIVRTPNGWVGRYDTFGSKGKTAHLAVTPSLGQEVAPWVSSVLAVKRKAAAAQEAERRPFDQSERANALEHLRKTIPFVNWGPRRQRYTTRRHAYMDDWGLDEREMEGFLRWMETNDYDVTDNEREMVEMLYVFRAEQEQDEEDALTQTYFWGGE